MVEQIFYWTGVAIWWSICITAMASFVAGAVVAPVLSYKRMTKYFWQWKWAAEVAHTGLTREDVEYAVAYAKTPKEVTIQEILAWVEQVKNRAAAARRLSK